MISKKCNEEKMSINSYEKQSKTQISFVLIQLSFTLKVSIHLKITIYLIKMMS